MLAIEWLFVDSQAAINALNSRVVKSKTIDECGKELNDVGKKFGIFLFLVPSL